MLKKKEGRKEDEKENWGKKECRKIKLSRRFNGLGAIRSVCLFLLETKMNAVRHGRLCPARELLWVWQHAARLASAVRVLRLAPSKCT